MRDVLMELGDDVEEGLFRKLMAFYEQVHEHLKAGSPEGGLQELRERMVELRATFQENSAS